MLSFFRRVVFSPIGKIIALVILVLIALAFAAGDITGLRPAGGTSGGALIQVGSRSLTEAELRQRLQLALNGARQQNPTLDMSQFVNAGGFDQVIEQMTATMALEEFARHSGMAVTKAAVDGAIAGMPVFQGPDGKFNQETYRNVLAQQRVTAQQIRDDVERDMLVQWLVAPTIGATQVPVQMALPYASLMLERRQGSVGFIPTAAIAPGVPPSATELATYYARNRMRYTVPERRVLRYATVPVDRFKNLRPTDAELLQAYRANASRFSASERRTIRQVIVADQAAANALAARVKSGTAIADAARAAGLEASIAEKVDKAGFAQSTASAIADAAFAAPQGAVVGPVRSPLGWHVLRIETVDKIAARTLETARAELLPEVAKRKSDEAITDFRTKLEEAAADGSTFAELVSDAGVQPRITPALLADGRDVVNPTAKPDPALAPLLQAGFQAEQGDDPQIVPTGPDGGFAIVALDRIVSAAPRPLNEIRDGVTRDFLIDRALRQARQLAVRAVAAVNGGQALGQALGGLGVKVPAVQQADVTRQQLAQARQQLPPPVVLLFSMVEGKGKLLAAPNRSGYFVVHLGKIHRGDASGNREMINRTRAGIGGAVGREYVEQFAQAAQRQLGTERNSAALAKLKAELGGQSVAGAD